MKKNRFLSKRNGEEEYDRIDEERRTKEERDHYWIDERQADAAFALTQKANIHGHLTSPYISRHCSLSSHSACQQYLLGCVCECSCHR